MRDDLYISDLRDITYKRCVVIWAQVMRAQPRDPQMGIVDADGAPGIGGS